MAEVATGRPVLVDYFDLTTYARVCKTEGSEQRDRRREMKWRRSGREESHARSQKITRHAQVEEVEKKKTTKTSTCHGDMK